MLLSRGKLSSCPSSLLQPRLLSCPVALVVFGSRYLCGLGPALKYAVKFIVRLSAVLLKFISVLLAGHVLMKANFYQELTHKFIHLVVAQKYICRYFYRLGPALKYAVLKFRVPLAAVYSLGCGRE